MKIYQEVKTPPQYFPQEQTKEAQNLKKSEGLQSLNQQDDEKYTTHYFDSKTDKNLYRLWLNHYKNHIELEAFLALQNFDVDNPKEGQAIKVPNIAQKQENKPKDTENPIPQKQAATSPSKKTKAKAANSIVPYSQAYQIKELSKFGLIQPKPKVYSQEYQKQQLQNMFDFGKKNIELDTLMQKTELKVSEIKQARKLIEALKDPIQKGDYFEKLQYKVKYYNQRDSAIGGLDGNNIYHNNIGDFICNMSSMAMGLELFGVDNPYPDMQFDDALEKTRQEKYSDADRTGVGQFKIAKHFGYVYKGLEEKTEQTFPHKTESIDYKWYQKNVIPYLRQGNAITIGIVDKNNPSNGHIVHLVGVTDKGLIINDPMGNTKWEGNSYKNVMYDNANSKTLKEGGTSKGKHILWSFDKIKNAPIMRINWIRATQRKK